jgi:hypothetical protein
VWLGCASGCKVCLALGMGAVILPVYAWYLKPLAMDTL